MGISLVASPEIIESLPMGVLAGNVTGTIEGQVIDLETSERIEGVRVKVGRLPAVTTDFEGNFIIENVPIGIHDLILSKADYKTTKVKVAGWPKGWAESATLAPLEVIELTRGAGEERVIEGESVKSVRGFIALARGLLGIDGIPAIFALLASIFAFGRKSYKFTLVGSVIGILCLPFILGLIAMILIILSKDEFFWAEVKGKSKES
jgi:hypothetical protein